MRRSLVFILFCVMLVAVGMVFKTEILRSFSDFLMKQDPPEKADIMVVLSGDGFDRGIEGARLFKAGYAPRVICPGGNLDFDFLIINDTLYESDVTRRSLVLRGTPDSAITTIHYGTSTREEADTILGYCIEHHISRVMVVTSLFHTRRAGKVYKKRFEKYGIKVTMRGAHDVRFDENLWWQNEYGLISLNNEYMKTLYYLIRRPGAARP